MNGLRTLLVALFSVFVFSVAFADTVNVNNADQATLAEHLSGVGPVIAERIVEYREEFGPFTSPEDLLEVRGIGPATLEVLRDQLEFGEID